MNEKIINSQISNINVKLYESVKITESYIGENCVVGDFSRVTNSIVKGYNRIDRNTLLYHSFMGFCSYIGSNSVVMHSSIGKYCSIAWGVTIGPANHDYRKISSHDFLYNRFYNIMPPDTSPLYDRFEKKTIIGNDVWIGTNVTILNGLDIGDGAVIGANTIVTADVPPYSIVVGNPGRVVKFRFSAEIISQLIELKWWDLPHEVLQEKFNLFRSNDIQTIIDILSKKK